MSEQLLTPDFFEGDTLEVAGSLLGQSLCRQMPNGDLLKWTLTEVEAYDGFEDKASHAHRGKTKRNAVMFGPPGHYYVYLCYGVHWLLNIVTGPVDYPAAVLIRGTAEISGPGRLTKALAIDKALDGRLVGPASGLWLEASESPVAETRIERTPRVGVDYAGPEWAQAPYRFVLR